MKWALETSVEGWMGPVGVAEVDEPGEPASRGVDEAVLGSGVGVQRDRRGAGGQGGQELAGGSAQVEVGAPALFGGEHLDEVVEHGGQPRVEVGGGCVAGDQPGFVQGGLADFVDLAQRGAEFFEDGGPGRTG